MSDLPIVEKIRVDILRTLRTVKRTYGYATDLTVSQRTRYGVVESDNLCIVEQRESEILEVRPEQRSDFRQVFAMHCFVIESEDSTRSLDERINIIRADVEKALLVDPLRGGLAIDTTLQSPEQFFADDGRYEGVTVIADVHYRTLYGNPFK